MSINEPTSPGTVHLLGVAGTGMGAFAGLLKAAGFDVRGSDVNVYPPMSTTLERWGIEVRTPYKSENIHPLPSLFIVGNVIRRNNPEAEAVVASGIPYRSFPAALGELFLEKRHSVVVAGTHGKTTTSSLIAHTLVHAGLDAGFLVGGVPQGNGESFRVGAEGAPFVVEGDEYDTAYFDKGPKFLHYRPQSLLITSIEYDHADIYASVDQIVDRFVELIELVPEGGRIVAATDDRHVDDALRRARHRGVVERYHTSGNDWSVARLERTATGQTFDVVHRGTVLGRVTVPLHGLHNVENAIGAYAVLAGLGLHHEQLADGFSTFGGVRRRMEVIGTTNGVTVVDDFAHHPTAVARTIEGATRAYPQRRMIAVFEPRSATSCRAVFQTAYADAFSTSPHVFLAPVGRELPEGERLNIQVLVDDLALRGVDARSATGIEALVDDVAAFVEPGDVVLGMSNGAFGGFHRKLLDRLRSKASAFGVES